MFGIGRRGRARHRALSSTSAPSDGQQASPPAGPSRPPLWATGLVFAAFLVALYAGWRMFGDDTTTSSPGSPRAGSSGPTAVAPASGGMTQTVTVGTQGATHTTQQIRFQSAQPKVAVSVPVQRGVARHFKPLVKHLRVSAAGRDYPTSRVLSRGESKIFELATDARIVVVSYDVTHAVVRNRPAAAGRALLLATPVTVRNVAGLPSRVEVDSPHLLDLGCLSARGAVAPCGSRTAHGWQVSTGADQRTPGVVARLDIPVG